MIFTVIIFLLMCWGLGYTLTYLIRKRPECVVERIVMDLGIGLGAFPLLGILLNLFRIILDWRVFLVLSIVVPMYSLIKGIWKEELHLKVDFRNVKIRRSAVYFLLVLCIFGAFLGVYLKGAFGYPYLEDDDPWGYAEDTKYIQLQKTFNKPVDMRLEYAEPYPQGYQILMGVLYQTHNDVIAVLKLFNALIIAMGLLFFFYFCRMFTGSAKKSLIATFLLSIVPWYMGHFVWSQSLSLTLFFPAFYALMKTKEDWRYMVPAAVVVSGILLSHELGGFIFGVMFGIYWIVDGIFTKARFTKRFFSYMLFAAVLGLMISLLFYLPATLKYGARGHQHYADNKWYQLEAPTEQHRVYYFEDFWDAKPVSRMDTPIGLGEVLFILAVISLILIAITYRELKKRPWIIVALLWLLFTLLGLEGNALPARVIPYRWGAFFVVPLVLIAAEGWSLLTNARQLKRYGLIISFVLVIGLVATSAYPKYKVQTSMWPPGAIWGSMDELQGYLSYVKPLPHNTKVFALCSDERKVFAFDKYAEVWDPEYMRFKKVAINSSAEDLHAWLVSRDFEYLTFESSCVNKYGANATNEKLFELGSSGLFALSNSNNGFFLFRV